MRNLSLKQLTILSLVEKSAIRLKFDSGINVIYGDNDTGKSCLMKSIYYALGATPAQIHPEWLQIKPITLMQFQKDEAIYNMFRYGKYMVLFDEKYEIINSFTSIGNELAPYFEDFFDFKLKLKHSTSGELKTPLPSHYFLPFYIDQDTGWSKNWNSFDRLSEFKLWRKDIIEYHTGIKPNEYYILKAQKTSLSEEKRGIASELQALERVYYRTLEQKNSNISLNIDVKMFQKDIDMLVVKLNEIREIEAKYRDKVLDLYNEKAIIEKQIKLAEDTRKELNKDFEFAQQLDEEITCPICGAVHQNTFAERYVIAQDENHCYELLLQLNEDQRRLENQIQKETEKLQAHIDKKQEVETILNQKRGQIKFNDYIENVGQSKLINAMQAELGTLKASIEEKEGQIKEIDNSMRKYVSGEITKEIEEYYLKLMKSNLYKLNVHKLKEEVYKSISCQIKETGSDLSRAILAYYFSVLFVMNKYSSTYSCPIVLDSPLQDEQDDVNSVRILKFIRDNRPANSQLILSCVDLHGVEFSGNMIELNKKYSLLNKDEYSVIFDEMQVIIDKAMDFTDN